MLTWNSLDEWKFLLDSGQLRIQAGTRLSPEQVAILGHTPRTDTFSTGAPGSFAAQDAPRHLRQVTAAKAQQQRAMAAAAQGGDPVASMARKLEVNFQRSGVWDQLKAQESQSTLQQAMKSPEASIRATLMAQEDPGLGKRLARAVLKTFADSELTPPPRPGRRTAPQKDALAELTTKVQQLIATIERYLSHRTATVTGAVAVAGRRPV